MLTPFEGSTLAIARNAVVHAFQTGNQKYTNEMLIILYISSAKNTIISDCEKFQSETDRRLNLLKSGRGITIAEDYFFRTNPNEYLKQRNILLFKKIMLLFEKAGLTEFSNQATPQFKNRPTG